MAKADDCRTSDFRGGRNFREFKYATIRDCRYSQPLSRSGVAALSLYGNVSGFDLEALFASPAAADRGGVPGRR